MIKIIAEMHYDGLTPDEIMPVLVNRFGDAAPEDQSVIQTKLLEMLFAAENTLSLAQVDELRKIVDPKKKRRRKQSKGASQQQEEASTAGHPRCQCGETEGGGTGSILVMVDGKD
jgi:hypothetical protein